MKLNPRGQKVLSAANNNLLRLLLVENCVTEHLTASRFRTDSKKSEMLMKNKGLSQLRSHYEILASCASSGRSL